MYSLHDTGIKIDFVLSPIPIYWIYDLFFLAAYLWRQQILKTSRWYSAPSRTQSCKRPWQKWDLRSQDVYTHFSYTQKRQVYSPVTARVGCTYGSVCPSTRSTPLGPNPILLVLDSHFFKIIPWKPPLPWTYINKNPYMIKGLWKRFQLVVQGLFGPKLVDSVATWKNRQTWCTIWFLHPDARWIFLHSLGLP